MTEQKASDDQIPAERLSAITIGLDTSFAEAQVVLIKTIRSSLSKERLERFDLALDGFLADLRPQFFNATDSATPDALRLVLVLRLGGVDEFLAAALGAEDFKVM